MKNDDEVFEADQARIKARELLFQALGLLQDGGTHDKSVAQLIEGCVYLLDPSVADFESQMAADWVLGHSSLITH
jgi:hypothetical protein